MYGPTPSLSCLHVSQLTAATTTTTGAQSSLSGAFHPKNPLEGQDEEVRPLAANRPIFETPTVRSALEAIERRLEEAYKTIDMLSGLSRMLCSYLSYDVFHAQKKLSTCVLCDYFATKRCKNFQFVADTTSENKTK